MQPPPDAPALSWQSYRPIFVNAKRIEGGRRFLEANADVLARAEAQFGVPPEIVIMTLSRLTENKTR